MADQRKTILHGEDVLSWREYVKALFRERHNVELANDFDVVLTRLAKGGVDLLILDHLMPGTEPHDDAAAVCAHLRKKYPKLPVIIFTGALADSPTTREELERMIGAPVVCKEDIDSEPNDLVSRAEEHLR